MNLQTIIDSYNKYHSELKEFWIDRGTVLYPEGEDRVITKVPLYEFLNNPKHGYRQTFDKDPEMQKAFWAWMENKNYAIEKKRECGTLCLEMDCYFIQDFEKDWIMPTPQMLTGYIQKWIDEIIK